jgi:hypothetical protein
MPSSPTREKMLRQERAEAKKQAKLKYKESDDEFDEYYKKILAKIRKEREKAEKEKKPSPKKPSPKKPSPKKPSPSPDSVLKAKLLEKIREEREKKKQLSPKKPSPKKASPKKPSPKKASPKLKKADELATIKINLKTERVQGDYLSKLKGEIDSFENDNYSIESLERDIESDSFVKSAIKAQREALEFKLKLYRKLSKTNWQADENQKKSDSEISTNLNELIKVLILDIEKELLKPKPTIEEKRYQLLNILYDPDNGIETIQGQSRQNVRLFLVKTIYMFIKVPAFFFNGFINFILTGPAGSGKTKIAGVIAHTMRNLGILLRQNVNMATKQNLIGQFIGQSGPKTRNILAKSMEGVLFIDEAYTLTPCPGEKSSADAFSHEAVGELINFIDKFVGCLVVIVAGYKTEMNDCFLKFNQGMARRFPKGIDLQPYLSNDMFKIFEKFLSESIDISNTLSEKQRIYIKSVIEALNEQEIFDNQAGDMLNLSKSIGEDAILYGKKYTDNLIMLTFKKFCAAKNIAIIMEP